MRKPSKSSNYVSTLKLAVELLALVKALVDLFR
jgi:hypothetical protein